MTSQNWISLAAALAWPIVALFALLYVWRSDAIGKLIRISDSVQDLSARLSELVKAEEGLKETSNIIIQVTENISQVQEDFVLLKADIQNIRDKVEQIPESALVSEREINQAVDLFTMYNGMEVSWRSLVSKLQEVFGYFDARSVAAEVQSFTHGNRKGPRLSREQAEEIARLHSSIKSYVRRRGYLQDWLTVETFDWFTRSCLELVDEIALIEKSS